MQSLGMSGLALLAMGLLFAAIGLGSPCAATLSSANPSGEMTCAGTAALTGFGFVLAIVGAALFGAGWRSDSDRTPVLGLVSPADRDTTGRSDRSK